jgi:NADPH:quinone reductase-like Zn-dependent oxidoreductase
MVLNLAPIDPPQLAALVTRVRPGGIVVNTTVWMTAPGDEERRVRGVNVYVHSDAEQLAHLVGMVDRGDLFVDVSERVSLPDLPTVHARAATGDLSGKIVVVPAVS